MKSVPPPSRRCFSIVHAGLLFYTVLVLSALKLGSQEPPAPLAPPGQPAAGTPAESSTPIAIVPIDAAGPDQAASVTGALQVSQGKAIIGASGTVTSGSKTTVVTLPGRGELHVCASTSVHLSADSSVPPGEPRGLMMALDHGALEASFATGRNSDILLTPDFRILISGPGASDVMVRLGPHGDTCVDNPGADAPYVLVSSVFGGGAYRVQPGQRVMFQHGSLNEVVDQEKEPCGCPAAPRPNSNDFPIAESAGLAAPHKPEPVPPANTAAPSQPSPTLSEPLVYAAPKPAQEPAKPADQAASPPLSGSTGAASPAQPPPAHKKPGFFHRVGSFFRRLFGAD